jgi:hypothetical protein
MWKKENNCGAVLPGAQSPLAYLLKTGLLVTEVVGAPFGLSKKLSISLARHDDDSCTLAVLQKHLFVAR